MDDDVRDLLVLLALTPLAVLCLYALFHAPADMSGEVWGVLGLIMIFGVPSLGYLLMAGPSNTGKNGSWKEWLNQPIGAKSKTTSSVRGV